MKFSIGVTLLLVQAFQLDAFAPSSSFTSFRGNSNQYLQRKHAFSRRSSSSRRGTEMKMMFDQLANAISDIAKNIGGRQR
jgi:hypothetical protein